MKERKEVVNIADVEDSATMKKLNGALIVNVCFIQLKIHSPKT
jgi:hypothetical protein